MILTIFEGLYHSRFPPHGNLPGTGSTPGSEACSKYRAGRPRRRSLPRDAGQVLDKAACRRYPTAVEVPSRKSTECCVLMRKRQPSFGVGGSFAGFLIMGLTLSPSDGRAATEPVTVEFQSVPEVSALATDPGMPEPQPLGAIQVDPQAPSEASTRPSTQNGMSPTAEPEPFAMPEGPLSVAEVMDSIQPSIRGFPTRFHSLLTPATDRPATADESNAEALYNVPILVTPKVEGHMRFFHTSIRDRFEQWLLRLGKYKKQVEDIFLQFDLPSDLVFLSLVESGFNPHAYSRARATGPWQFMQGTAKVYGLRVDQYVDERRDPIKSTVAAAHYLRDLHDLFGTWPLAMAAYNAGEGKVMRALQKTQSKSFWEIAQTRHLKKETKEYVPRFMAATIIAKNPDRYGFPLVEPVPHQVEEVVVSRSLHLRDVAATTGVSYDDLERLNPELRRSITPPGEDYHLKVPVGAKTTVEPLLDQVKTWKGPLPSLKKGAARSEWYKVRVGDTMQTVAKRFRLSVPDLKAKNHLAAHHILRPGDRLRIGP